MRDGFDDISDLPPLRTDKRAGKPMAKATSAKYDKIPAYRGCLARFPRALLEVAKVSAYGTRKHEVPIDDMSYLDIPDGFGIYSDAQVRHMLGEAIHGPVNTEDGSLLHAAQNAWDALARLEIMLRNAEAVRGMDVEEAVARLNASVEPTDVQEMVTGVTPKGREVPANPQPHSPPETPEQTEERVAKIRRYPPFGDAQSYKEAEE